MSVAWKLLYCGALGIIGLVVAGPQSRPPDSTRPPLPPPIELVFERIAPAATIMLEGIDSIGVTSEAVWLGRSAAGEVHRVDPESSEPVAVISIPGACGGFVSAFGSLWVPRCDGGGVARVDLESNEVSSTIPLDFAGPTGSLATGVGSIWAPLARPGTIVRIDPDSEAPVAEIYLAPGSVALGFDDEALWAVSAEGATLTKINPHTNLVDKTVSLPRGATSLAIGEGAVWTLNVEAGSVSRILPKTGVVSSTIDIGSPGAAGHLAVGAGAVWVTRADSPLTRIDARTNRVVQNFSGEGGGGRLVFGHRSLWLAKAGEVWRVDPRLVAAMR